MSKYLRKKKNRNVFVFEEVPHRLLKSLSDLNGTDPYIHSGSVEEIFRELNNALASEEAQPTVSQMRKIYDKLECSKRQILLDTGARSLFESRPFKEMNILAAFYAEELRKEIVR